MKKNKRYVYHRLWESDPHLLVWFTDIYTNVLSGGQNGIDDNLKPVTDSSARRLLSLMESGDCIHEKLFAGFWRTTFR